MSLLHFYREEAGLPTCVELAYFLQHNTHYTVQRVHEYPVITQNITKIRKRASA